MHATIGISRNYTFGGFLPFRLGVIDEEEKPAMPRNSTPSGTAEFARRIHLNGTIDSICLRCFHTVATSQDESALLFHEARHICENPLHISRHYQTSG